VGVVVGEKVGYGGEVSVSVGLSVTVGDGSVDRVAVNAAVGEDPEDGVPAG